MKNAKLITLLWLFILFVLSSSCNRKVDIADTSAMELAFKEEPGVPGAVCVLEGCHLPLSDPRCDGGSVYCCLKSNECCCLWAVPSPDGTIPSGIHADPITLVHIIASDTIFTTGAIDSVSVTIQGSDTIVSIVDMRVDSTWIKN